MKVKKSTILNNFLKEFYGKIYGIMEYGIGEQLS